MHLQPWHMKRREETVVVFAHTNNNNAARVTFYEDMTGIIINGTIWIRFNYTFTEPPPEEITYIRRFKVRNKGTVIIK
jgi:hypothetical protein